MDDGQRVEHRRLARRFALVEGLVAFAYFHVAGPKDGGAIAQQHAGIARRLLQRYGLLNHAASGGVWQGVHHLGVEVCDQ